MKMKMATTEVGTREDRTYNEHEPQRATNDVDDANEANAKNTLGNALPQLALTSSCTFLTRLQGRSRRTSSIESQPHKGDVREPFLH